MKIEYCPDDCNYRDKRIRYCGFCLKKILEERKKEKEDHGTDGKRRNQDAE